ncbi:unnamed protein product [Mytilus coruscus]|uniref:Uncharacterized protein n=1 Tax=Mytilus coruscus TaxID=42192 RepID=A0A6J8B2R6_MYTCO|nr:unnamed protein product [Mytilus coruscus]
MMKVKIIEDNQGGSDDSSLNAIRLHCSNPDWKDSNNISGTIIGKEGPFGMWKDVAMCPNGEVMINGDNSAANYVRISFRNIDSSSLGTVLGTSGRWGDYGAWREYCAVRSAIFGLKRERAKRQTEAERSCTQEENIMKETALAVLVTNIFETQRRRVSGKVLADDVRTRSTTKDRDVLLMFEKDIGPAIEFACNYNGIIHVAKTPEMIRCHLSTKKTTFFGSLVSEDIDDIYLLCYSSRKIIQHGLDNKSYLDYVCLITMQTPRRSQYNTVMQLIVWHHLCVSWTINLCKNQEETACRYIISTWVMHLLLSGTGNINSTR